METSFIFRIPNRSKECQARKNLALKALSLQDQIMNLVFLWIFAGLLSGFLSGLLGIGGGIITVPILYYTLFGQVDHVMQTAVATALASSVITTCFSTWAHYQKRNIQLRPLLYLASGLVFGCLAGPLVATHLSGFWLRRLFSSFLMLLSARLLLPLPPPTSYTEKIRKKPLFLGGIDWRDRKSFRHRRRNLELSPPSSL